MRWIIVVKSEVRMPRPCCKMFLLLMIGIRSIRSAPPPPLILMSNERGSKNTTSLCQLFHSRHPRVNIAQVSTTSRYYTAPLSHLERKTKPDSVGKDGYT